MRQQCQLFFACPTLSIYFALAGVLALQGTLRSADEPVNFARQILPILSDKCFVCHGPDGQYSDVLRLDSYEAATNDLGGYKAIDPMSLDDSETLLRIQSTDDPMPPGDAEKQLTQEERDLLARWIKQGGKYTIHWAFVPPKKELPGIIGGDQLSEIDAFVLEKLQENEPPQPPFEKGGSRLKASFEKGGSRLKASFEKGGSKLSPRRKLDFAPEADRATLARRAALILTGLPPEPGQLGTYLADETVGAYERLVDQLLMSPRFGEHQARYWLDAVRYGDTHGLHLDNRRGIYPYRDWIVYALNNNLPLDDFITWQLAGDLLPEPTLQQLVATGLVRLNPSTAEGGAIPAEFQVKNNFDRTENLGTVFLGMSLICARCHNHKYDPVSQTEYYRLLAFFNSTAEPALDGNSYTYGPIAKAPANQSGWYQWNEIESAREALLANASNAIDEARLTAAVAYADAASHWRSHTWKISNPQPKGEPPPTESDWLEAKDLPGVTKEKSPKVDQAVWISFGLDTPIDQVLWLTVSGGPDAQVLLDGESIPSQALPIPLRLSEGAHEVVLQLLGTEPAGPLEVRLSNPWDALAKTNEWIACEKEDQLLMLSESKGPLADLRLQDQAQDIRRQIKAAKEGFTTSLIARDLPTPRETRVLKRGEYDQPIGDPLEPGLISVLGAFPKDASSDRLGLAQWLTSKDHPLVSRVLVNRIWQRTFGEGLVRTPEDFGLQGQQPTHPELLDWLAVELIESGWDLKHILRLMVTSRTFRQSSVWRTDIDDPENRLLARGPRFRLDAEVLRDVGLWASGLLASEVGGEGVKPYQPDGMWLAMAHPASNTKKYERDHGQKLYRRSLYVYWKRTSPHPMMTLFDAPSRETSCVRRSRTNTSSQSLGLFNETQRIEMSRVFAARLIKERDNDNSRLDYLFSLVACRSPDDRERQVCSKLLQTMKQRYSVAEDDALALLSIGDAPTHDELQPAEHAAWTQLVVTVLASDIAILVY